MDLDRKRLYADILDIDMDYVIPELFLAYKQRKITQKELLLVDDKCAKLIEYYYRWSEKVEFETLKSSFVTKYCNNESKIEGVNDDNHHGKQEIAGMHVMYDFIHSGGIDDIIHTNKLRFGSNRVIFKTTPNLSRLESSALRDACIASTGTELALIELHCKLYELTEFKEEACFMRNDDRYLPGTGTELTTWTNIGPELKLVDIDVQNVLKQANNMKNNIGSEALNDYIDKCVLIKCKLIKIHPFFDRNGRTIRAFINKLLEEAGLPPIYIKSNERSLYHTAMNLANNEGNYTLIQNFYKKKIVDSIIELDINERLKNEKNEIVEKNNEVLELALNTYNSK